MKLITRAEFGDLNVLTRFQEHLEATQYMHQDMGSRLPALPVAYHNLARAVSRLMQAMARADRLVMDTYKEDELNGVLKKACTYAHAVSLHLRLQFNGGYADNELDALLRIPHALASWHGHSKYTQELARKLFRARWWRESDYPKFFRWVSDLSCVHDKSPEIRDIPTLEITANRKQYEELHNWLMEIASHLIQAQIKDSLGEPESQRHKKTALSVLAAKEWAPRPAMRVPAALKEQGLERVLIQLIQHLEEV